MNVTRLPYSNLLHSFTLIYSSYTTIYDRFFILETRGHY